MNTHRTKSAGANRAIIFPVVIGLLYSGCASTPIAVATATTKTTASPVMVVTRSDDAVQPDLGAIALVFHPAKADFQFEQLPLSRSEAGRDGASQFLDAFRKNPGGDPGGAIILLPAVVGLGTAGGWIRGAFSGMNANVVDQTTATLANAAANFSLIDRLEKSIVARAGEFTARKLTIPTTLVRIEPPKVRPWFRYDPALQTLPPANPPHPLAAQGIDTIAVVETSHALAALGQKKPPFALRLQIKVRLIRTADWSSAGEFTTYLAGAARPFTDWAQNDAAPLREEWEAAVRAMEEQIIDTLARRSSGAN